MEKKVTLINLSKKATFYTKKSLFLSLFKKYLQKSSFKGVNNSFKALFCGKWKNINVTKVSK